VSINLSNFTKSNVNPLGQQAQILTLLLGVTALLLAVGFLFTDNIALNSNYRILLELFNSTTWAGILFTYGAIKIYHLLDKLPHSIRILTSVFGTWLWLYIFLSFIVFDPTGASPAELLIFLPLACEAGELVLDIFNFRLCSPKQRNPSV